MNPRDQALKYVNEIIGGSDHEVSNLIMMIEGASLILDNPDTSVDAKKLALQGILDKTKKVQELISNLRILTSEDVSKPSHVNVLTVINSAMGIYKTRFKNHRIFTKINIPENLFIEGKELKLTQAFLAFLTNSHEAMKNGSEKWLEVGGEVKEDSLYLYFKDSRNVSDTSFNPENSEERLGAIMAMGKTFIEEQGGEIHLKNGGIVISFKNYLLTNTVSSVAFNNGREISLKELLNQAVG